MGTGYLYDISTICKKRDPGYGSFGPFSHFFQEGSCSIRIIFNAMCQEEVAVSTISGENIRENKGTPEIVPKKFVPGNVLWVISL